MIDKLASAYGCDPVEFVRGTNRETYYVGERLEDEQRAKLDYRARVEPSAPIHLAHLIYSRIYDMFEAPYGGRMLVPVVHGEELYIEMRSHCKNMLAAGPSG